MTKSIRAPSDEPRRVHVVSPTGRIITVRLAPGLSSRIVDGEGHIRSRAAAEGFKLLVAFAKERPGFCAAYAEYELAAERGETTEPIPTEWIPPSILKLREKLIHCWVWPEPPKGKAAKK